jgi:regulator of protease activity HflC (stomatin/prohibitin superfamily)
MAVTAAARKTLAEALGRLDFADIPDARRKLPEDIRAALGAQTGPWGIEISGVSLGQADRFGPR